MGRIVLAVAVALALAPRAGCEEWYDAYQRGVEALRQTQGGKAAEAFRRAIRFRPEPGTNVITYGTNKLQDYFPYLRLAEALLLAGDPQAAREVLKRSEARGKEPGVERARIAVMVEESLRKRAVAAVVRPEAAPAMPADPDLALGIHEVERGDFEAAVTLLAAVSKRLEGQGRSLELAQAHLYLGIAYIGMSQQERLRATVPARE